MKERIGSGRGRAKSMAELQRLKPVGFGAVYVVAKATTHKDSGDLTGALKLAATTVKSKTKSKTPA